MISQIVYIFATLFILGILIFIHELGHYWAAKWVGMRVEVFSIGFGKPIISWKAGNVSWRLCWFPIGGYVKIFGQERKEKKKSSQKSADSFYAKSPWARMFVAIMGPLANILLAFLLFVLLWIGGGKTEPFSQYTKKVGWIHPHSELYQKGIRQGDIITHYNHTPYQKQEDHFLSGFFSNGKIDVKGFHINYFTGERWPFSCEVDPHMTHLGKEQLPTSGVMEGARFFIHKKIPHDIASLSSQLLEEGDRLLWIDGEYIFSQRQLQQIVQNHHALLRVSREGRTILVRIPLYPFKALEISEEEKEEFIDSFIALNGRSEIDSQLYIPYKLDDQLQMIDHYAIHRKNLTQEFSSSFSEEEKDLERKRFGVDNFLQPGDRILSIHDRPIDGMQDLLSSLQEKRVQIIVQKMENNLPQPLWTRGDQLFDHLSYSEELLEIVEGIGTEQGIKKTEHLELLSPIIPKKRRLHYTEEQFRRIEEIRSEKLKKIINSQDRQKYIEEFHRWNEQLSLGIDSLQDLQVQYNPKPHHLLYQLGKKMKEMMTALFQGMVPIKSLSGPIGITLFTYQQSQMGMDYLFFWMGLISLNLGFINLLPIPLLDGGFILFSLLEILIRKPISPLWIERLSYISMAFFLSLFLWITYHDIYRLWNFFLS